jgi:hypothetical protein
MNTDLKAPLGQIGVFLLPSLKMKSLSPRGQTYDQELHDFLLQNFKGYTVTTGNISGYWLSGGKEHYGEHREYKVAFSDRSKVPGLERYIAALAVEIGEQTVYCELGDEAFLLSAKAS